MAHEYDDDVFDSLTKLIQTRPGLKLQTAAGLLSLHRHTVSHIVHLRTGLTFREWRDGIRRSIAIELLLARPRKSVKEISYLLGFDTARAFNKFTKRTLGITPTCFRIECRHGQADYILARRSRLER